jgi:hypothetical protein
MEPTMESFVHLRKGRTPKRLHADLDGLKDDELGRDGFTGVVSEVADHQGWLHRHGFSL